jgi:hypothetical protein
MTINTDRLTDHVRRQIAKRLEAAFAAMNIQPSRFIIGDNYKPNQQFEAGVFEDEQQNNHYWLIRGNGYHEYLIENSRSGVEPIGIPFFSSDFGITNEQMLNQSVALQDVRRTTTSVAVHTSFTIVDSNENKPYEGYYVKSDGNWTHIFYTERGVDRWLGKTEYPWVVGMMLAWYDNYKNIRWSIFSADSVPGDQ